MQEDVLKELLVTGDSMSFMIQSTGAKMLIKKDSEKKDAVNYVIIGSLAVRLLFFGFSLIATNDDLASGSVQCGQTIMFATEVYQCDTAITYRDRLHLQHLHHDPIDIPSD